MVDRNLSPVQLPADLETMVRERDNLNDEDLDRMEADLESFKRKVLGEKSPKTVRLMKRAKRRSLAG